MPDRWHHGIRGQRPDQIIHDEGAQMSEQQFDAASKAIIGRHGGPKTIVTNTAYIERGRAQAKSLEKAAAVAEREIVRHSHGWRALRLLKRARLGTTFVASSTAARSMRAMFGWDATP